MSKILKTEQVKTKSKLKSDTTAKKPTTSTTHAVNAKQTTKSKSLRSSDTTKTAKESVSSQSLSTKETKDTKLLQRSGARMLNSVSTISKSNETNVNKLKTSTERNNRALKTQATATTVPTSVKKVTTTVSKNVSSKVSDQRKQPLRARHTVIDTERKKTASLNASKTNIKPNLVLDTYHNVTVTSPPLQRKEQSHLPIHEDKQKIPEDINVRPSTRTLDTNEILILKSESARLRSEQEVLQNADGDQQPKPEPIAFEVKFEEPTKPVRDRSRSQSKTIHNNTESDIDEYADDFESYESDFESGSSSPACSGTESPEISRDTSSISSENESNSDVESGLTVSNDKILKPQSASEDDEEEDDESDLTQFPITVIQRDKDRERKLDSGNYEMPIRTNQKRLTELSQHISQPTFEDSLDTFSTAASEQLDSGISSYGTVIKSISPDEVIYGGYANFNTKPVITPRGVELVSKIKFDTLTFTLLELKPITYDVFMQTFGKLNTTQCSTQTQEQRTSLKCQTDECETRSVWTQHPPQYDLNTMQQLSGLSINSNFCGELPINDLFSSSNLRDEYENSLLDLSMLRAQKEARAAKQHMRRLHKPIDCERLNQFLQRSALLISNILNANNVNCRSSQNCQKSGYNNTLSAISTGYRQLDTYFLNALHVVRIFANAQHNLVLTVHACRPDADVYRSDFSNLLMVWSTSDVNTKPLRLLSTWSEVCRAEICSETTDIVVCGLRDGSVALWDLRETHSFCSKLDGYLSHFAATQSIIPSLEEKSSIKFKDLGAAVDVKSFRTVPKLLGSVNSTNAYKTIQFISLHDTGILTVWTLIETGKIDSTLENHPNRTPLLRGSNVTSTPATREYSSPWARVKLMQSAIFDLSDYLERGIQKAHSKFEKTKSLFQHNIYSDQVLRELNETQAGLRNIQGLRFTSIDVGCERVYVCTNRNFIIACSKTLKAERFRKININESRFLFPTALCVLSNEDFLAVGLSNGSVMILNHFLNEIRNMIWRLANHVPFKISYSTRGAYSILRTLAKT